MQLSNLQLSCQLGRLACFKQASASSILSTLFEKESQPANQLLSRGFLSNSCVTAQTSSNNVFKTASPTLAQRGAFQSSHNLHKFSVSLRHQYSTEEEEQLLAGVVNTDVQTSEEKQLTLSAEELLIQSIKECVSIPSLEAALTDERLIQFNFELLSETLSHLLLVLKNKNQLLTYPLEYSSILVKLSDKFIEELSALKTDATEGRLLASVKVLHTWSQLPSFNPGGDKTGLLNISAFYRIHILPQLRNAKAAQYHEVLVEVLAAFSKLFGLANRQEQEALEATLRQQLAAAAPQPPDDELLARIRAAVAPNPHHVVGDELLLRSCCQALEQSIPHLPSRDLGKLAQALAASNFMDYAVMTSIATTIQSRLPAPGCSLGNLLDSFCRLELTYAPLCEAVASQLVKNHRILNAMPIRELADIVHGLARAKYFNADFFHVASGAVQRRLSEAGPKQVSQIAWSFAQFKVEDEDLFLALCSRALSTLDDAAPPQVASLLGACARLRFIYPQLYERAAGVLTRKVQSCQVQSLSGALKALTSRQIFDQKLMDAAAARVLAILRDPIDSRRLIFQNFADLAWAFALADADGEYGYEPPAELFDAIARGFASMDKAVDVRNSMLLADAFAAAGRADAEVFGALERLMEEMLPDFGPPHLCRLLRAFTLSKYPVSEQFWRRCLDTANLLWNRCKEHGRGELAAATAAAILDNPATAKYAPNHPLLPELRSLYTAGGATAALSPKAFIAVASDVLAAEDA